MNSNVHKIWLAGLLLCVSCGHVGKGNETAVQLPPSVSETEIERDTASDPSFKHWVNITPSRLRSFENIWAISDVHGEFAKLKNILANAELITVPKSGPPRWSGGAGQLVIVVGDMICKGDNSVEVVKFLQALTSQAKSARSEIILLLGNNEIDFLTGVESQFDKRLLDSAEKNADWLFGPRGYGNELKVKDLARRSTMARFFRDLPAAVIIADKWIFTHSGYFGVELTKQDRTELMKKRKLDLFLKSVGDRLAEASKLAKQADLKDRIDEDAAKELYRQSEEIYLEQSSEHSFIANHNWWEEKRKGNSGMLNREENAAMLDLKYETLFFGHDPDAFREEKDIAVTRDAKFVKLDAGMNRFEGQEGRILRCPVQTPLKVLDGRTSVCFQRGPTGGEFELKLAD